MPSEPRHKLVSIEPQIAIKETTMEAAMAMAKRVKISLPSLQRRKQKLQPRRRKRLQRRKRASASNTDVGTTATLIYHCLKISTFHHLVQVGRLLGLHRKSCLLRRSNGARVEAAQATQMIFQKIVNPAKTTKVR